MGRAQLLPLFPSLFLSPWAAHFRPASSPPSRLFTFSSFSSSLTCLSLSPPAPAPHASPVAIAPFRRHRPHLTCSLSPYKASTPASPFSQTLAPLLSSFSPAAATISSASPSTETTTTFTSRRSSSSPWGSQAGARPQRPRAGARRPLEQEPDARERQHQGLLPATSSSPAIVYPEPTPSSTFLSLSPICSLGEHTALGHLLCPPTALDGRRCATVTPC